MVAARAELAPVADQLVLSGTATARRISLISPATEGLVEETLVDAGDHVNAGQVLARLDKRITALDVGGDGIGSYDLLVYDIKTDG